IVIQFVQLGFIKHIPDIFKLDYEKIRQLEGWKDKSVSNLREGIERSKERPLWRLINGMGIRHVGVTTAKYLANQVQHLADYKNWSLELLMQLQDVGPKVAASIHEFFSNENNIELITQLEALGVNV